MTREEMTAQYEANCRAAADLDARHRASKAEFDRRQAEISRIMAEATEVLNEPWRILAADIRAMR
jgi:hypothetical protein